MQAASLPRACDRREGSELGQSVPWACSKTGGFQVEPQRQPRRACTGGEGGRRAWTRRFGRGARRGGAHRPRRGGTATSPRLPPSPPAGCAARGRAQLAEGEPSPPGEGRGALETAEPLGEGKAGLARAALSPGQSQRSARVSRTSLVSEPGRAKVCHRAVAKGPGPV